MLLIRGSGSEIAITTEWCKYRMSHCLLNISYKSSNSKGLISIPFIFDSRCLSYEWRPSGRLLLFSLVRPPELCEEPLPSHVCASVIKLDDADMQAQLMLSRRRAIFLGMLLWSFNSNNMSVWHQCLRSLLDLLWLDCKAEQLIETEQLSKAEHLRI